MTDAHLVSIPLVGVLSRGCWRAGLLLHHCSLPMEDLEEEKWADDNDKMQNVHRRMRASDVRGRRVGSRVRPTGFAEKEKPWQLTHQVGWQDAALSPGTMVNQESEANPTCSGCVALLSTLC